MKKKTNKNKQDINWKPVQIDENLINEFATDGLVGIEECTDYSLINSKNKNKKTKRKLKQKNDVPKKKAKILEKPTKSDVEVTEEDVENVSAWSTFGLPQVLLKALQVKGFLEPTTIQSLTLPAAIFGKRNILGAAETGSGKTLAFGLPILAGILREKEKNVETIDNTKKPLYALILTPTRELAVQIKNHLIDVAKFTDINIALVVGGMAAVKQERILNKQPEIVVATPGRLWELIQQGNPHLCQVDNIKFLAIDETDRLLEKGHFEDLHNLLERINQNDENVQKRQHFVFSATLTLVHELPRYLLKKLKKSKQNKMLPEQKLKNFIDILGIKDPKVVDITQGVGISKTLTESRIVCTLEEKDYYVFYFLKRHPGKTLIFCNSISCVRRLSHLLEFLGCRPLPLHASMQQKQRLKNLERFTEDKNGILVATDVAARGLDIPSVDHVLHYQIPRTSEGYIHRSGRTARLSSEGITVLLMEPVEIPNYIKLCRTLNKSEDIPSFPIEDDYLKAIKERVNLARELDQLQLEVTKANSEQKWFQKAAQDMDLIVDDFDRKFNTKEVSKTKKAAAIKRKQLDQLLAKPIFIKSKFPINANFVVENLPQVSTDEKKAVDVMKVAIQTVKKDKKKFKPLFKPKKKNSDKK